MQMQPVLVTLACVMMCLGTSSYDSCWWQFWLAFGV